MKVTFKDIESLPDDTIIYHSLGSLWWTHDYNDLEKASKSAIKHNIKWIGEKLKEEIDTELRTKLLETLGRLKKQFRTEKPVDPEGNMLQQIEKTNFVEHAKKSKAHFGKNELEALMAVHHQNCNGIIYRSWEIVNRKIDKNE